MQQRLLTIAIAVCAIVLVLLGADRAWRRWGAPRVSSGDPLDTALALGAGVVPGDEPSGLTDDSPVSTIEGFHVASTTDRTAPLAPSRTPATLREPWSATFTDDLCAGRESAWSALRALLDAAPEGTIDAELTEHVAEVAVRGCFSPESRQACTFAREGVELAPGARTSTAWLLLAHCGDEIALPLLDRVDTPAPAILRFVVDRELLARPPVRLPAYLLQSVEGALASAAPDREPVPFHALANALGRYDDPVATRALVALYAAAPGYVREHIGIAIRHPNDDRSRAIHQESCATVPAGSMIHACNDGSLAARVGSYEMDVHLELARHPEAREAVIASLETCAGGSDPLAGAFCFRRLAELDRERAAAAASGRIASANVPLLGLPAVGDPPPFVSELEHELRLFPSEAAVRTALASAGILREPDAAWMPHPVTMIDALSARGHAFAIDPESGTFPTPHDVLLRRLARLVSPALDEVVFEQVPPDETQMAVGRYTLRAHVDGRIVETYARNYGDFYDLEAVVGFVNALLLRRGALDRCEVDVADESDGAPIVCATLPQLAALHEAQVLVRTGTSE
jgi:hypothetical protein